MSKEKDRCIAIAGLFQAASQVARVAHSGMTDSDSFEASIYSLFQINAESTEAVYGGAQGVKSGLRIIRDEIGGKKKHNVEVSRYVISLMHLERQLQKRPDMLKQIGEGLEQATQRLEHYPMVHSNILAQLADIYANTISTLKPRIMVQGEPLHLQNPENANRIRALLLAGIRAVMLWRQRGGNRLQILLGRKRLTQLADELLKTIE